MLKELENTLLNQIEMLNDESLFTEKEKAEIVIAKSEAISKLTSEFMGIQRYKLDVVQTLSKNGGVYADVLGIEKNNG